MAETGLAPIYRYYTADLLTNEILAEIPFRSVSYERAIKSSGSFSGSIPVIEATKSMDIYESTMPGNTALYVVRNGVCVWGGIVWSRSYDVVGRVLQVTAAEFTSYFYHRRFWKTWGHGYGATLTVTNGVVSAILDNGAASSSLLSGASIKLEFDGANDIRYDGYYKISTSPAPTYNTFNIDNAQSIATVNVISRTGNIATAITETAHGLTVNDTIELDFGSGAGSEYTGTHVVLSVGGGEGTVFTFHVEGADTGEIDVSGTVTRPIPDGVYTLVTVSVRADTYDFVRSMIDSVFADFVGIDFPNTYIEPGVSYNYEIIQKEVTDGVATLKTAENHNLAAGQAVQVKNIDPMFDGEYYVTETRALDEFSYALGGELPATPVTVNIKDVQKLSATDGIVSVTTLTPHGFLVGQSVAMETGTTEGGVGPMLNGTFTISTIVSPTVFKYSSGFPTTIPEIVYDPATASSEIRRNFIYNPSFEVATTGWSSVLSSTISRITTDHASDAGGTASLQVVCDYSSPAQGAYIPTKITVSANTAYYLSAYVKGTYGKFIRLAFAEYNSSNTLLTTTYSDILTASGNWQRISVGKTTGATTASVQVSILNASPASSTFFVDGVLFEQSSTLNDYFDGNTDDTYTHTQSWASTANNSESIQIHNIDIILGSISSNVVTLTATEPPDFFSGRSVTVTGVYPQLSITEKSFNAASSKATITTSTEHNLQVGDTITVSGLRDYSSVSARSVAGTTVQMQTNLSHNLFIGDSIVISDMKDLYTPVKKKINGNVATITTSAAHNITTGNSVTIENVYDTYPVVGKVLSNNVATLTLTVPVGGGHNFAVNDSISVAGIVDTSTVISKTTENGLAILTTDFPHNFLESNDVTISGLGAPFDGTFKVVSTTATRITYEIAETLTDQIPVTAANGIATSETSAFNGDFTISAVTANTISFNKTGNDVLFVPLSGAVVVGASPLNGIHTVTSTPATNKITYALNGYNLDETDVVAASDEVGFAPILSVDSVHTGAHTVTTVSRNTFTFTQAGLTAVPLQNTVGVVSVNSIFNGTAMSVTEKTADTLTYTKTAPNNILEMPANSLAYVVTPGIYNGTYTLTGVSPDLNTITYARSHVDMPGTAIQGYGTATVDPVAVVSTFGPFPGNADIGVKFSTSAYSGKNVTPVAYRGFELVNVGEALSSYSDSIDGFEYRIDCAYDAENNVFTKTFVLIPINFPNPPAAGEVSPLSRFGADKLVFEYPGNIINLSIEESAENSATRFFAVGENDLGPDAGPPFSVASSNGLLRGVESVRKWPLLDDDEKISNIDDETVLYSYSERYLAEARPPDAKLSLSVNGSLQPVVGSYAPGDWCSLIVEDDFVLERLRSDLEPRDNVIVRKIDVIKVSVPDGTTFPEKVDLTLVPEWEVDKRG